MLPEQSASVTWQSLLITGWPLTATEHFVSLINQPPSVTGQSVSLIEWFSSVTGHSTLSLYLSGLYL